MPEEFDGTTLRERVGAALGRSTSETAALTDAELADRVEALRRDRDRWQGLEHTAARATQEARAERDAIARERDDARAALADRALGEDAARLAELDDRCAQVEATVAWYRRTTRVELVKAALTGACAGCVWPDETRELVVAAAVRLADAALAALEGPAGGDTGSGS